MIEIMENIEIYKEDKIIHNSDILVNFFLLLFYSFFK